MNVIDWTALSPLILIAGGAVLVMLVGAISRRHSATNGLTVACLAIALLVTLTSSGSTEAGFLLNIDAYARFFIALILAAALAVTVLAHGYLTTYEGNREEFYTLVLVASFGGTVLACSTHFASFFLGLETLTIGLYALIAYPYLVQRPLEAGIKYLILAAASSAFLLFGMALVYASSGTMDLERIAALLTSESNSTLVLGGMALILVGVGFKLALVPFHLWVADVYEGAPVPVTAFLATVSKGAVFALLLRYFHPAEIGAQTPLFLTLAVVAVASMLGGNLLALQQNNVKRILAYSSVAHMGYLLIAFLAGGAIGTRAAALYVTAYFVTSLGAFGVVTLLSRSGAEADRIDDYRSLFWRRPLLASVFTAMLLSLAGIPLTAGFVGKFYLFAAGASASLWLLILVLIVASTIGLFYYLRIVIALYAPHSEPGPAPISAPLARPGVLVLAVLTVALVWIGAYPAPLLEIVRDAVRPAG